MEVHDATAFFTPGHIRHQVDASVLQGLQAFLPLTRHAVQLPAFGLGDFLE